MKSLNIKIPLSIAQELDNNGQLNPNYITGFIVANINSVDSVLDKPINEMTYTYTFKVPTEVHSSLKLLSVVKDIPMNEIIGRLLTYNYKVDNHG